MKTKTKSGFLFYHNWKEQIDLMTEVELRNFIDNLIRYDKGEKVILNSKEEKLCWLGIVRGLEINMDHYKNRCEANRENGKLGGRPRNPNNPNNPLGLSDVVDNESNKKITPITQKPNITQPNPNNLITDNRQQITDALEPDLEKEIKKETGEHPCEQQSSQTADPELLGQIEDIPNKEKNQVDIRTNVRPAFFINNEKNPDEIKNEITSISGSSRPEENEITSTSIQRSATLHWAENEISDEIKEKFRASDAFQKYLENYQEPYKKFQKEHPEPMTYQEENIIWNEWMLNRFIDERQKKAINNKNN